MSVRRYSIAGGVLLLAGLLFAYALQGGRPKSPAPEPAAITRAPDPAPAPPPPAPPPTAPAPSAPPPAAPAPSAPPPAALPVAARVEPVAREIASSDLRVEPGAKASAAAPAVNPDPKRAKRQTEKTEKAPAAKNEEVSTEKPEKKAKAPKEKPEKKAKAAKKPKTDVQIAEKKASDEAAEKEAAAAAKDATAADKDATAAEKDATAAKSEQKEIADASGATAPATDAAAGEGKPPVAPPEEPPPPPPPMVPFSIAMWSDLTDAKLVDLEVQVDGKVLARREERDLDGSGELQLYSDRLAVGNHELKVIAKVVGDSSVFSYVSGYTVTVKHRRLFPMSEEQGALVRVGVVSEGDITRNWTDRLRVKTVFSAQ